MRVFFGIELDPATALAIATWRERQFAALARPVPAANFHLTLAFGGEFSAVQLDRLGRSVDDAMSRKSRCGGSLLLDQTGFWPNPGLYWLGASEHPETLNQLAEKLRSLVVRAGAKRERKHFLPHITLFRRCAEAPPSPAQVPGFALAYDHFSLFESRQGRSGVSYQALQEWPLTN